MIGRWHWAIPTLGVTMIFFSPLLFNQLVVSKLVKTVAARCSILRQNAPNSISSVASPLTQRSSPKLPGWIWVEGEGEKRMVYMVYGIYGT